MLVGGDENRFRLRRNCVVQGVEEVMVEMNRQPACVLKDFWAVLDCQA